MSSALNDCPAAYWKHFMLEKVHRLIQLLPLCNNRCREYLITALWIFLLIYPVHQYYYFKNEFTQWDLLLFSGVATFIVGLRIVADVPVRFRETIARLQKRQVLNLGSMSREELFQQLGEAGNLWARVVGLLAALTVAAAFVYALIISPDWQRALLGVAEVFGAYIAGTYLGRMASYGQLGRSLQKMNLPVKVDPFHVDGVGGLKPVGDYYFFQAMIVAIPAFYLAIWWFLFPVWPRDYGHWDDAYLGLMSGALVLVILAFLVPLWAFHQIMVRQKEDWQDVADTLSNEIGELQRSMESSASGDEKELVTARIEDKIKRYWEIENMVTWPVDIKTKRRFRLNNILLFVPILGDITKRSVDWSEVLKIFKSLGA
jgi:hypothetical protein